MLFLVEPVGVSTALAEAPVVFEADVSAPILGATTVGIPVAVPPTWMFEAFSTTTAARLMLPLTRIPASPALILPTKAIRSALPTRGAVPAEHGTHHIDRPAIAGGLPSLSQTRMPQCL